ncbi:MAG: cytochrome P450 [Acidobacteriota bacterium]|nr:cytochrome P450 [Acidobacteriota bacterium]
MPARKQPLLEYATGLFSVNGGEHRRHRRLLAPAFHKKQIEDYHADMIDITRDVLAGWRTGERRNLHADMMRVTLRIATKTLFGEDLDGRDGLGEALQESLKLVLARSVILLPYDLPGLPYRRFLDVVARINAGIRNVIERKRAAGQSSSDIISILQTRDEDDSMLTEGEVVGHATVIFAAGHETSSNALAWTLFLLSQHPRLAAELQEELDAVLGGTPPTLEHLDKLPLLEHTIRESMRLIPPVPWNNRTTNMPTELGGHTLPTGTEVIVSIYHTHHMPELYEQPEVFDPHRWDRIERDAFEYNPFGAGPRMCIGAPFAWMEMKIVLAMILQRFRLQFIPGTAVDRFVGITTSMRRGLPMLVCEQDRQFGKGVGGVRGNVHEMVKLPD